jgi:hypothetical protein
LVQSSGVRRVGSKATHECLRIADWNPYADWHLIIDEVPAVWGYIKRNFGQSGDFIRPYLRAEPYDRLSDYYRLFLTREGRDLRYRWQGDDIVQVIKDRARRLRKALRCASECEEMG